MHVVRDFAFGNGQTLPELKLAYTTLGPPSGQPVLVLHGTGGTGGGLLTAAFGVYPNAPTIKYSTKSESGTADTPTKSTQTSPS